MLLDLLAIMSGLGEDSGDASAGYGAVVGWDVDEQTKPEPIDYTTDDDEILLMF